MWWGLFEQPRPIFSYKALDFFCESLALLCLAVKVMVYMVGSWRLLPWQNERQLSLLHSAVTGSKPSAVWANECLEGSLLGTIFARVVLLKHLLGWVLLLRVNFEFREGSMWNAASVSSMWALGRSAVEDRSSLWLRLILVVQVLPGQVGTGVSHDTLVPCHHMDDTLPIGLLACRKWKDSTDHLPKHRESILLWKSSEGSWQSIQVRRAEAGMALEKLRGEVC